MWQSFISHNCSFESVEFKSLKIIEKYKNSVNIFLCSNQFMRVYYLTYFQRYNCNFESVEFNASKILEKYKDLI